MGVGDGAFCVAEAVDEDIKGTLGGDAGVELADGTGAVFLGLT